MISTVAIDLARQCEANVSVLTVIPPNAEKSDIAVLEKIARAGGANRQGSWD